MMPIRLAPAPQDAALAACIRVHRKKGRDAWKGFRVHEDGGHRALLHLHHAYGARCTYCDHAHARTIDHVVTKASKPKQQFSWSNWRSVCMDCNNQKGVHRIVDPGKQDPRDYLVFSLASGAPFVVATGRARALAERTRRLIANQTLNEARRTMRVRVVAALKRVGDLRRGARQEIANLMGRQTPHRAVLRELVLERDNVLNPYLDIVDRALVAVPELAQWAADPTSFH